MLARQCVQCTQQPASSARLARPPTRRRRNTESEHLGWALEPTTRAMPSVYLPWQFNCSSALDDTAAGAPWGATDWASIPATTRTEVAQRLALAGALRSVDAIIRFVAQHGSAEDMREVREGRVAAGQRLPACLCVYASRLRTERKWLWWTAMASLFRTLCRAGMQGARACGVRACKTSLNTPVCVQLHSGAHGQCVMGDEAGYAGIFGGHA